MLKHMADIRKKTSFMGLATKNINKPNNNTKATKIRFITDKHSINYKLSI